MNELETAREYLVAPRDAFWEWQDEAGEVATWINGQTIVFRAELALVLEHLAPNGLPPLAPLLLLLAAARDNWGEDGQERGMLESVLHRTGLPKKQVDVETFRDVLHGLHDVSRLEVDVRATTMAKAVLAEVVFEGLGEIASPEDADSIVGQLQHGMGEVLDVPHDALRRYETSALMHDLRCLRIGLRRVDTKSLRLRRDTGLDQTPLTADLDVPPATRVRNLLSNLVNDDELSGLARLTLDLMAAVTLPRAIADQDELQVGGVSDIANRGPLDRLLLSELAHDNLTLAVRVAVNEAMYLRRESPPRTPPQQRALLLENGIRSWGVPRFFATAVALAMTCTSESNTEVVVFRAKRDRVVRVDLTTREGLVAHLAALETDLHAGRALQAFADAMSEFDNLAEPVLVTTVDGLADKAFQRILGEQDVLPMHIATVSRDGDFQLLEQTGRGKKVLRSATLDVDDLRTKKSQSPALINRDYADKLPAIFRAERFPLLLSHNVDPHRTWRVDPFGVLSITNDRRLMFWTRRGVGGMQISDELPKGNLLWHSHVSPDGRTLAVIGNRQSGERYLLEVDADAATCTINKLDLGDRQVQCFCGHNGAIFAVSRETINTLNSDGSSLHELARPKTLTWLRDRFFFNHLEQEFYALSFGGRTGRLEAIPLARGLRGKDRNMVTFFDRLGVDGPTGLTQGGNLYNSATGNLRILSSIRPGATVEAIAADGTKLVLRRPEERLAGGSRHDVVDVELLTSAELYGEPRVLAEPFYDVVSPRSHRNRFLYIYADRDGSLRLVSRKHKHLTIDYNSQYDLIRLIDAEDEFGAPKQMFSPSVNSSFWYSLSVATWEDGSRAYLDSRGLLHLKSSDRDVPETTMVLSDGRLSGWCSDGRFWGLEYAIGEHQPSRSRDIYESAIRAFVERLP